MYGKQSDIVPIIATGINVTISIGGKNLPPVLLTPVANLQPVSKTPELLVSKFAAGVVDTSGAPRLANISENF